MSRSTSDRLKKLVKIALILALLPVGNAWAITLNFDCITLNDTSGDSCSIGEAQLSVEVQAAAMGTDFIFTNVDSGTPENPSIHEIYFDSSLLMNVSDAWVDSNVMLMGSLAADWNLGILPPDLAPGNLPGGGSFDADFGADSGSGGDGLREGDTLTVNIKALTFDRFMMALNGEDGDFFDIGLHVGSLVGGESESFISSLTPSPIPVPAAVWLFGTALIGFIGFSRRTSV